MPKTKLLIIGSVFLIAVSCAWLNSGEEPQASGFGRASLLAREKKGGQGEPSGPANPLPDPGKGAGPNESKPDDRAHRPIAAYDSKALDEQLTAQAKALGLDPKTYRMPFRREADGTAISRELGMFVIVNPDRKTVYLPDNL